MFTASPFVSWLRCGQKMNQRLFQPPKLQRFSPHRAKRAKRAKRAEPRVSPGAETPQRRGRGVPRCGADINGGRIIFVDGRNPALSKNDFPGSTVVRTEFIHQQHCKHPKQKPQHPTQWTGNGLATRFWSSKRTPSNEEQRRRVALFCNHVGRLKKSTQERPNTSICQRPPGKSMFSSSDKFPV